MPDYGREQRQARPNPWGEAVVDPDQVTHERHVRAISMLPDQVVRMPTRFGGPSSRLHDIVLRFGSMEQDGTVPGHFVAQTSAGPIAARRAIMWDPLLQTFRSDNYFQVDEMFRQLDPMAAFCGSLSRGLLAKTGTVMGIMGEMLVPRFFVIGTVGSILIAYAAYYWLWFFLVNFLLLYVLLPGAALAIGAGIYHAVRRQPLETAMFQAAWAAYNQQNPHAPR